MKKTLLLGLLPLLSLGANAQSVSEVKNLLTGGASQEWRIKNEKAGHLGCGEPGTNGLNWWSAGPNEKQNFNVYDCRMTFGTDGTYKFDPGLSEQIYANKDVTAFGGPYGEDYCTHADAQNVTYELVEEGGQVFIVFPEHTYFPYIANDDIWNAPKYRVESINETEANLVIDNGNIAWHYILAAGEPEAPKVGVFDWDVDSNYNLWKPVETGDAFVSVTPWFANNGWGQIADPAWSHENGAWKLTLPADMGGSQWMGQFPINTTVTASGSKKYNFYCVVTADNDCRGVTIKLTETDEPNGTKHDDNYFCAERHDIKAGQPFVYKVEGAQLTKFADAHALSLFFDFGGSPVGTNVTISNIYFEEQDNSEAPCDYYMPGTCKGWNFNDDTKFTYVGHNTWKLIYDEFNADFKVVKNGQWGSDNEFAGAGNDMMPGNSYTLVKGGGNTGFAPGIVVKNAVFFLYVAEDGTHTLKVTGTAREEHSYGLVGGFQGWNAGNAPLFTEQADGSWTIDVDDFPGGEGFKVSIDKSWTCFCPGSKADGNKTMEFGVPFECQRVDGADFNIGASGEKYNVHVVLVIAADGQTATLTIIDKATGIVLLETEVQPVGGKFFKNGEIIIVRDGVRYNVAGQRK